MIDIEKLADIAKQEIEVTCVHRELMPVLYLDVKENLEVIGITTPNLGNAEMEKVLQIEGIKQLLREKNVTQYAHVYEGWGTTFVKASKRVRGQIRDLPPEDRDDIAIVMVVRKGKGVVSGYTGIIDTNRDGTRKLREWQKSDGMQGRMVITNW